MATYTHACPTNTDITLQDARCKILGQRAQTDDVTRWQNSKSWLSVMSAAAMTVLHTSRYRSTHSGRQSRPRRGEVGSHA